MRVDARIVVGTVSILAVTSLAAGQGRDVRLVDAVKNSDRQVVQTLLKQKVDVNAPQPDGSTALHWAAQSDDLATADLLIGAGAQVNTANDYGITPLLLASENGSAAMIEKLLKAGAKPNTAKPTGETALMIAARTGKPERLVFRSGSNHRQEYSEHRVRKDQLDEGCRCERSADTGSKEGAAI